MTGDAGWILYSDESHHNHGAVRGVGAVSLRLDDTTRLSDELANLLRASGVRELKWEKVRTARMGFAAGKALTWTLDHALAGDIWIETLSWDARSAAASRARRPSLGRLRDAYATLLASVIARQAERSDPTGPSQHWQLVPDEQNAAPWTGAQSAVPQIASVSPARSETQPLIQLADLLAGLAVFSRAAYDAYERWLCLPNRDLDARSTAMPGGAHGSSAYRFALLDDFYTACVRRLPGISLRTRRGLYTWRASAPIQFRFLAPRAVWEAERLD
jgi:hypothetical protein